MGQKKKSRRHALFPPHKDISRPDPSNQLCRGRTRPLTIYVDSLDGLVEVLGVEGCAQVGEDALQVLDLHVALLGLVHGSEGLAQRWRGKQKH